MLSGNGLNVTFFEGIYAHRCILLCVRENCSRLSYSELKYFNLVINVEFMLQLNDQPVTAVSD